MCSAVRTHVYTVYGVLDTAASWLKIRPRYPLGKQARTSTENHVRKYLRRIRLAKAPPAL